MRAIVKVIKLNNWHWQGMISSQFKYNINDEVRELERLAQFQYPSAKQIFIIPIFFN